MEVIYEEKRHGLTIKIYQDDCDENQNPRHWDNLGTMVCFHRRYELGDKHTMSIEEAREFRQSKDIIAWKAFSLARPHGLGLSAKCG
jgi:hypothetical protein